MSFREKSAWVMAALMLGAGFYYIHLAVGTTREVGWTAPSVGVLVPFTLLVIVLSVVAQVILAVLTPNEANAPADERERPLLDRAGHWAGFVLAAGAVASVLHFFYHQNGVVLFHLIMVSLILSQISEYVFQIVLIRRHT